MSISTAVFDDRIQSEHENYGQMCSVPAERNGQNFAEDAVMDDIIGHSATPMGDDEEIDTPTVEMQEIGTGDGEKDNASILNSLMSDDQEIDDIANMHYYGSENGGNMDDDLVNDIDAMDATIGNDAGIINGTDRIGNYVMNDIDDMTMPNDAEEGGMSLAQQPKTIGGGGDDEYFNVLDDDEFVVEDENEDNDYWTPENNELDYVENDNDDVTIEFTQTVQ